ncbi:DUF6059 family protein [Streptomyces sp. NPDC028635]|uniref:DUF6059 family protein n=1 Tax=Streptomyces sp. NPDC028635 TaxID=3154800 RepID=UPI0033C65710
MASLGPWRVRRLRRMMVLYVLGPLWRGLVEFGSVHLTGEAARADAGRPAGGTSTRRRLLQQPPAGHPERLRPEVPLTALELALLSDLKTGR